MSKFKTKLAGWLRAVADKLDPPPITTADGGPGNPTNPTT